MDFSFLPEYWPYFLNGAKYTVLLAFFTVLCAVIPAMLLALARLSKSRILRFISGAYIELMRGTPMLVQLSIIYLGLFRVIEIPSIVIFGTVNLKLFIPGIFALTMNSSAYVAEIMRAGILAVDKGQTEAARSLGLTQWQCMRHIILPQAIKNILPALANEFVTIIKESSVCSFLGIQELMWGANATAGATFIPVEPLYIAAALYFCMTYPTSQLIAYFERRMRRGDAK